VGLAGGGAAGVRQGGGGSWQVEDLRRNTGEKEGEVRQKGGKYVFKGKTSGPMRKIRPHVGRQQAKESGRKSS